MILLCFVSFQKSSWVTDEVFEKVLACNLRFYQIAIEGDLDGRPPWRRHVVRGDFMMDGNQKHEKLSGCFQE